MKDDEGDEDSSCAVFVDIRVSFKKDWEIVGIIALTIVMRNMGQHGLIFVKIHKPQLSPAL